MNKKLTLILTGALLGGLLGSSMGLAVGGTAYNAAWFLAPLGAFIGWLISENIPEPDESATSAETPLADPPPPADTPSLLQKFVLSALAILATLWNFHIDLLKALGLLETFVKQPLLFVGLGIAIALIFPPFITIYLCAWLGALHYGIAPENAYRAKIK